jgi:hypothetical protein
MMDDLDERISELRSAASQLAAIVKELPGRNSTDDRTLTASAFDRAGAAVTLLGGPTPGGALRQQLRIIDNVREHLRNSAVDMSYDPNVDTGIRSLANALGHVRDRLFPSDSGMSKQLDTLADRVSDLDAVRGPLHAAAAARAFAAASGVITSMADQLQGRAGGAPAAASQATTHP